MTLFQVLSLNERLLVWASQEDHLIITWNQSLTLQAWQEATPGNWTEIEVRVLSETPDDFRDARAAAHRWLLQGV